MVLYIYISPIYEIPPKNGLVLDLFTIFVDRGPYFLQFSTFCAMRWDTHRKDNHPLNKWVYHLTCDDSVLFIP